MMWRNWNKADKTLLFAAAVFLFALCLNIEYADNTFAQGFLFCAEAALVGGIADWFAVTALFRKPLGFPWHTAILPRRREAFIAATGKMLQKEFFGKKALLAKVKEIDFAERLLGWLASPEHQKIMAKWLSEKGLLWLKEHQAEMAKQLLGTADLHIQPATAEKLVLYGVGELNGWVCQDECKLKIKAALEDYVDSKLKNPMVMMMAGLAQSMNIVNIEELSELAQKRLSMILLRLQQEDTDEHAQLSETIVKFLDYFEKKIVVKQELQDVVWNRIQRLEISDYLFSSPDEDARNGIQIEQTAEKLVQIMCRILSQSCELKTELNGLCYQLTARGALEAQELLGTIVHDVLGTMTDEQINRLVYDKAEPDLLWIRMNGSIVGAFIGFVIFAVMQAI